MDKERQKIVNEAMRIRKEIKQIFIDVEYWNTRVRTPFEEPVDPDPDGVLGRLAKSLDEMLEREERIERRSRMKIA